jgi:hypothetical protein
MSMLSFSIAPILAAGSMIQVVVIFAAVLIVSLLRKIAEERNKAARSKSTKPQGPSASPSAPPKRDNQFRNEIEAFLDEVGRRRSPSDPQRPAAQRGPTPPETLKVRPIPKAEPAKGATKSQADSRGKVPGGKSGAPVGPPQKPGAEIASRKSPVSADLGGHVRTHLKQYLDPNRLSQQVQADVGNAVEKRVRERLGETMTHGTNDGDQVVLTIADHPVVALVRNSTGMRTAIMVNEILGPPKGLRRKS